MTNHDFQQLVKKGTAAAEQGNTLEALIHLESAAVLDSTPVLDSYLGFCLAVERREYKKGASLCSNALKEEPGKAIHYLNLGRVLLAAGERGQAVKTLRQGLRLGGNAHIVEELKQLGIRKQLVFSSLTRDHPLNKHVGRLFNRLGMR